MQEDSDTNDGFEEDLDANAESEEDLDANDESEEESKESDGSEESDRSNDINYLLLALLPKLDDPFCVCDLFHDSRRVLY